MAGEKIEQVRAAALQVVAGLGDGEQNLAPRRVVEFGSPEFRALADRLAAESRQGALALPDDVLLFDHDELILVKAPPPAP